MIPYRNIFVAGEGNSFLKADYNQMELRMAAIVSGDTAMIEDFKNEIDVHLRTAQIGFEIAIPDFALKMTRPEYGEYKERFQKERNTAKTVNFGIIYGMTKWGAARRLGVHYDKAQKFIDAFFFIYPDVWREKQKCAKDVAKKGFVESLFGRRRRFPSPDARSGDKAFHFKISGSCADVMRLAMVECYKALNLVKCWPVLTCHDEMVYECLDEYLPIATQIIKEKSEKCVNFSVPLPVELKVCKKYE